MASPQTEDGFTRLANELLEALYAADLNGTQFKIMLYIIRQTYGWHRTEITLSNQEVADAIGTRREHVAKQRGWLREHGYLTKQDAWRVQKDYSLWGTSVQTHTSVQSDTSGSVQTHTPTSVQTHTSPTPPYKEKENLKKECVKTPTPIRQKPLGLARTRDPDPDGNLEHPMVLLVSEVLGHKPTVMQRGSIVDTVTNEACWRDVLTYWALNKYRVDSVGKMIDRYREQVAKTPNGAPPDEPDEDLYDADGNIIPEAWYRYEKKRGQPTHATYR